MRVDAQFKALCPISGPLAVAVSGGGDSMALLALTLDWAKRQDPIRDVHAFIVDHGLRAGSAAEAALTRRRCNDLGAKAQVLTWTPPRMTTAIQEKARHARYGLMGQACHALGLTHLLIGHTQDDQAETVLIRQQGGSNWRGLAGMAARAYAPVWPELYNLSLLRPLLGVTRQGLRAYNHANGVKWAEDPSNQNALFQRVRVRQILEADNELRAQMLVLAKQSRARRAIEDHAAMAFADDVGALIGGGFSVPRALLSAPHFTPFLGKMIACASGKLRRPDMAAAQRLTDSMGQAGFRPQTLGGAMVTPIQGGFEITRETGRWLARDESYILAQGQACVLDGRVMFSSPRAGLTARPLWPARAHLPDAVRGAFKACSGAARRSLFGAFKDDILIAAPELGWGDIKAENLSLKRLKAL